MKPVMYFVLAGMLIFGIILSGCAQPSGGAAQAGANGTATMTCEEYCPTQPHVMCTGRWSISGTYPNCVCLFICDTKEEPQPGRDAQAPGAGLPMSANIDIIDYAFQPAEIEVARGANVTWTNKGAVLHIVAADDGSFNSGYMTTGQTFSYVFSSAGNYTYKCGVHQTMKGAVIVR
ncbi:MAG: cupredoxin family copper-binding protein [Candidatus Micrarchaeia archaeon]